MIPRLPYSRALLKTNMAPVMWPHAQQILCFDWMIAKAIFENEVFLPVKGINIPAIKILFTLFPRGGKSLLTLSPNWHGRARFPRQIWVVKQRGVLWKAVICRSRGRDPQSLDTIVMCEPWPGLCVLSPITYSWSVAFLFQNNWCCGHYR